MPRFVGRSLDKVRWIAFQVSITGCFLEQPVCFGNRDMFRRKEMSKRMLSFGLVGILVCMLFLSGCEFDLPDLFPDPPSIISVACDTQELIDAINEANADPNHTLINLDPGCSYQLTAVNNVESGVGANGLPIISTPITIEGNNANIWRNYQMAANEFRIFSIDWFGDLMLNDLIVSFGLLVTSDHFNYGGAIFVRGGDLTLNRSTLEYNQAVTGGAIYNQSGTVTLNDSTITDNEAVRGGGITNYLNGTVTLNASIVSENEAEETGGGINNYQADVILNANSVVNSNLAGTKGGGIYFYDGALTINHSDLNYNQAGEDGGALYYKSPSASLVIERGTFVENTAGILGGGIRISEGHFEISNSGFTRNQTIWGGGGMAIRGEGTINDFSLFLENTAAGGGGLYISYSSVVTIEDTVFLRNESSGVGGGIENRDDLTLTNCTLYDNQAEDGGGISTSGPLTVISSTFRENVAINQGGGIYAMMDSANNCSLDLLNTTISGNQASTGAGITVCHSGKIAFSTIANNVGTYAGGIHASGNLDITNSIVANNQPSDCRVGINGSINPSGENLDNDGSCTGFTITAYPWLGQLADNGGTTYTHALGAFSPAIDAAADCIDTDGGSVGVDQRGESRPYGSFCDLGAYEAQTDQQPLTFIDIPFVFRQNVNCRIGPHEKHVVVLTHLAEDTGKAIGRNKDGTWLAALISEDEGDFDPMWCWVPDRFLDRHGDKLTLPVLNHLPSPDRLEPKEPTKEPREPDTGCGEPGCP
jgi:hypothetical protein